MQPVVILMCIARTLVIATPLACLGSAPAWSSDYAAEIETYVIEPCFRAIIEAEGTIPGLTDTETIAFLHTTQPALWEKMRSKVTLIVQGKPPEERQTTYSAAAQQCISFALAGSTTKSHTESRVGPERRELALAALRRVLRTSVLRRAQNTVMQIPWTQGKIRECLAEHERKNGEPLADDLIWTICLRGKPPFHQMQEALFEAFWAEEQAKLK